MTSAPYDCLQFNAFLHAFLKFNQKQSIISCSLTLKASRIFCFRSSTCVHLSLYCAPQIPSESFAASAPHFHSFHTKWLILRILSQKVYHTFTIFALLNSSELATAIKRLEWLNQFQQIEYCAER